jgi:tetratricopeptide (TPR) repeat protein
MSTTRFVPVRQNEQKAQLDAAQEHFYNLRFVEAYHILRRFFGRLPFQPEPDHAQLMGIFARVLSELGKSSELKFYMPFLEDWYERSKDPAMGYALAVLYRSLPDPRPEMVRKVLEEVLAGDCEKSYRAKAKMMLAHYYEWAKNDLVTCRAVIETIEEPEDPKLHTLWLIWRAKILRDQSRFDEAQAELDRVLASVNMETDWYGYFSAAVIQAGILTGRGQRAEALKVVAKVRAIFEDRNLKTLKVLMDELEERVKKRPEPPTVRFRRDAKRSTLSHGRGAVAFKRGTPAESVLALLVQKGMASKQTLVEEALGRPYGGMRDDKLIYHHVHSLREKFRELKLPEDVLVLEEDGYHLQAKMIFESEET